MIALLQRVSEASVTVDGETLARIGAGLLVFLAMERGDGPAQCRRMVERILGYRIFADEAGRMNRSLLDSGGELLLVPQFTLAADTRKGSRPSFTPAAEPQAGARLFECCTSLAEERLGEVQAGCFGADMQVALINDGPVTFTLRVPPASED